MAVQDLWLARDRETKTSRYGRGLRYRVTVPGHPTRAFATKEAATRHEAKLIVEGPPVTDDQRTIGQLLDLWEPTKAGLSPSGVKDVRLSARVVRARWGGVSASEVLHHEAQAWIVTVGGVDWRRKVWRALKGALTIAGMDAPKVSLGRRIVPEAHFLAVDQVNALAEAAGPRHGPMVWLMATVGSRITETVSLDVGDVDRVRGRVRVRKAKSGRGRDVPIPASVLAMLDLDHDGPLFRGRGEGGRLSTAAWRREVFHPAARAAKLPEGVTPHDLRHTAASWAIMSGATVKDVQAMLGHKSAAMTLDIYAGWWPSGLDEVSRRVDALIGASAGSDRTDSVPRLAD